MTFGLQKIIKLVRTKIINFLTTCFQSFCIWAYEISIATKKKKTKQNKTKQKKNKNKNKKTKKSIMNIVSYISK